MRIALARMLPDESWPGARKIGGWWPRTNKPEIDLVGADRYPANRIAFAGSIKWRPKGTITNKEIDVLAAGATQVPGVTPATPLIAVCPGGRATDPRIRHTWIASDLLDAWP